MVPEVQQKIVKVFTVLNPNIKNLVDPFMGGGTAITAGLYNGLNCHGQDINPLSVLVSKVKTSNYDLKTLKDTNEFILSYFITTTFNDISVEFKGRDRWFEKRISKDISKLREAILTIPSVKYRQFFWVLLAETIRLSSNDRTTTYKLHRRAIEEIERRSKEVDVYATFSSLFNQVCEDLKTHSKALDEVKSKKLQISIKLIDSTEKIEALKNEDKYDLVITSPPYGDNKTTVPYGQHSYLPLQWIPMKDIDKNAKESLLSTTSQIDNLSLGGSNNGLDGDIVNALLKKSNSLNSIYKKLQDDPRKRYKKIISFFLDFDKVLNKLKSVTNKNSYQAVIIGNRTVASMNIPNNKILRELMESNEFRFITEFERKIHNKRMPKKNNASKTMNVEKIIVTTKD
jgi:DNA modification methylase